MWLALKGRCLCRLQAWRKRWFVLRRGRMSGNPDVLEYYRNNHSKKPIRIIDLNECEVLKHSGPNFIKKEFQNNFVFIVRTTYRTFYLVAKTEEEMQIWVHNISQICNFGHLEDGTGRIMIMLILGFGRMTCVWSPPWQHPG